jgi:hypothetical protein
MDRRWLSLLFTLLAPLACQRAEASGPVQTRSPQQVSSPLEDEARRHLRAIWTAEKAYFGERNGYSEQVRQIGFEPDAWCADGARLAVTSPPADPRQALGCHFIYELAVDAAGDRWSASAHGFGPAAGIELALDQASPPPSFQRDVSATSLGAATPTGWTLSQQSLQAEALGDLHLLYRGEKAFYANKARYTPDPAALVESPNPGCPAGTVPPRPVGSDQIAGCDFVYGVRVTGAPPLEEVSFRAHGVGRAVGIELGLDIGGDREGIPYVPSKRGPVQAP